MAYLDLDDMFAGTVTRHPLPTPVAEQDRAGAFTPLEWNVIALAKRDSLRSLTQPGRLARAMGSLFGSGTSSVLADPRLEALRRMAVHAWRRGFAVPMSEIQRFLTAGFTEAQIETLVNSVCRSRGI
jgi:hypothetical protein